MSLVEFEQLLARDKVSRQDRTWFPKWYARFEEFLRETGRTGEQVHRGVVIEFSQTLLRSGTRAAFRLQAFRAVASYHRLVRQHIIPDLADVM
ncbi:MAG: hypothetical protein RIK87_10755 [Fuerstiella sp.]